MLSRLPEPALLRILDFLDFKDLYRVGRVNTQLWDLSRIDRLWKRHCSLVWGVDALNPETSTWLDTFVFMYKQWGRYLAYYKEINAAWTQIRQLTQARAPAVFNSLLPGLTEDQLDSIEKHLKLKLPGDLRCSYRMCNGQRLCSGSKGLLGYYDVDIPGEFLFPLMGTYHGSIVEHSDYNCIPIAGLTNHSKPIFMCLEDCQGQYLRAGTIFNPAGLEESEDDDDDTTKVHIFIFAQSFKEFITEFAKKLHVFPVINGTILKYEPNSSLKTGPITVNVATCFARELSWLSNPHIPASPDGNNARFCYRYRITMIMDRSAPPEDSCQLENRHWIITDERNRVERVDGPGVVGTHPIMRPGGEYTWISGTSYGTSHGIMAGHFDMRNLYNGFVMTVQCGRFVLDAPLSKTYDQRKQEWELAEATAKEATCDNATTSAVLL